MLNKLKRLWPFAKKVTPAPFLLQQPSMPSAADASLLKLYQSCSKCPLDVFLDCLFDGEYTRLIISGTIPEDQLQNVWQNLYTEYCELTNSGKLSEHMETMRDANLLMSKAALVDGLVACLRCYYDPELIAMLDALMLKPGINADDSDEVMATKLDKVMVRAKKILAELDSKKATLQNLEDENKKNEHKRDHYEDSLAAISKATGYHIKPADITVARFIRETERLHQQQLKKIAETKNKR